jgi:integrase
MAHGRHNRRPAAAARIIHSGEQDTFHRPGTEGIYAACDVLGGPKPPGPGAREWTGSDLQTFIMLSVYTGLRISDVATFNIRERLEGNDVFLRMHKTRKPLFTWIPDWLVSRLKELEQKNGALIFRTGQSLKMQTMAELWRVKLAKAFKMAGPFE